MPTQSSLEVAPDGLTERRAAALVEAHADFVYRCLGRFGVQDSDLADMAQETFVIALRKAQGWKSDDVSRPWLYGIARKVAAGYRRRASRRREQASDALDQERATTPSPEELAAANEARHKLGRILDSMSVDERAAFVMFEIEGLTGREIAETTGAPVQTIFTRLRRARAHFERQARKEAAR